MDLYVPGFHRQAYKHVIIASKRSEKIKEQRKPKGSLLMAETLDSFQNAQFGLIRIVGSKTLSVDFHA